VIKRILIFVALAALPAFCQQPVTVTNSSIAVTQSGNWSVRMQDGAGNTLNSTSSALNVFMTGGSLAFGPGSASTNATLAVDVTAATATQIKASAGNLYAIVASNPGTAPCYLQFYNSATSPTLGTAVLNPIMIQAGVTVPITIGAVGYRNFSAGIYVAETTTATGSSTCSTAMPVTVYYQ